jgi:hypothetical protein
LCRRGAEGKRPTLLWGWKAEEIVEYAGTATVEGESGGASDSSRGVQVTGKGVDIEARGVDIEARGVEVAGEGVDIEARGVKDAGEGIDIEDPGVAEVDREGGGAPEGEGGGASDGEGCDPRQGSDTLEVGAVGSLEIESIVLAEVVLRGWAEIVVGKSAEFISVSACPALTAPKCIIEVEGSVGSLEIESIVLAEVVLRGWAEIVVGKSAEFISVSACPALTAPKCIIEVEGSVGSVVFDYSASTFGNINI